MATFDELRLQELLKSFNNQGDNTGITSIDQQYTDPKYTYDGLYQDPDRFLDYDNSRKDNSPMGNDYPFTGNIPTNRLARRDAIYYNKNNLSALPSNAYGEKSNYFNNFRPRIGLESQIPQNLEFLNNQVPQIDNQIQSTQLFDPINIQSLIDSAALKNTQPQNFNFDTSYGVANEADVEQEFLPDQKKKLSDMGRNFGISSLLSMITGNPIIGLLNRGAKGIGEGLAGLNNKMQNSMFGKSKTLAEYFNNRKIAKATGSKDFMNRPRSERNYTGPSGGNNTGGDTGAKGAADSFSNKSGMGRTGY